MNKKTYIQPSIEVMAFAYDHILGMLSANAGISGEGYQNGGEVSSSDYDGGMDWPTIPSALKNID